MIIEILRNIFTAAGMLFTVLLVIAFLQDRYYSPRKDRRRATLASLARHKQFMIDNRKVYVLLLDDMSLDVAIVHQITKGGNLPRDRREMIKRPNRVYHIDYIVQDSVLRYITILERTRDFRKALDSIEMDSINSRIGERIFLQEEDCLEILVEREFRRTVF